MKKVLFVCYGLGIGGIEKCLVNLINALPESQFEIDVLLMNPEYDLQSGIKRKVNIIDSFDYVMNTTDTLDEIKNRGGVLKNKIKFISYCLFRLLVKCHFDSWFLFKKLEGEYDIAISYSHHDYSKYYVIDKVCAKRKVLWYHNGTYEQPEKTFKRDVKYFGKFNYIVAVSTDCANMLKQKFCFNKGQLVVLRNIYDIDEIVSKAKEFIPRTYKKGVINIATVGRLTKEKGADVAVKACEILKVKGYSICWHWAGDGNQKAAINELIESKGLQNVFILEGNQSNPYPYINFCDIYVQPSYYEAYSTTVTEARILQKPIITTNVGGMRDQIESGTNGVIVSIDAEAVAQEIMGLIDKPNIRASFSKELECNGVDNNNSLSEYYNTVFK